MKELNDIEKVLRHKLQNFEAPVRDGLWTNIQSSVSASSSTAAAASSKIGAILLKTVAAITVVGIGTYFIVKNLDSSKEKISTTIAVETSDSNSIDKQTSTQEINKVKSNQTNINTQEKVSTYTPTTNSTKLNKNNSSNPVSSPLIKETNATPSDVKIDESKIKPESTKHSSNENTVDESKKPHDSSIDNTNKETKKTPAEIKTPVETDNNIISNEGETTPKEKNLDITLPNVITPNGDGNNDVVIIKTPSFRRFLMEVYNNRAELIFRSTDQNIGWSGQDMSGNPLPDGNYFYKITAEGEDGTVYGIKTQTISLVTNKQY